MTNKKSTTAFQRAIDGVHTLLTSPQRVAQKAMKCFFKNKIQLSSNKVCYEVPLCENFTIRSFKTAD